MSGRISVTRVRPSFSISPAFRERPATRILSPTFSTRTFW